ncbi:TetR family transcriptional regulator [Bifidobacterium primatium]|uniref:TetR family transcriptional regulator n=1 Tax=Bifidobacterium primatium TaxID=2045438 RepID=A0A2M9H7X5_9BIFI|nr:TetR/AcrR family transcriptional regulator [Bifidobacterium primatium]PJM72923.1 TetR family transcriptional regulator [Bifidobacterium primatium]
MATTAQRQTRTEAKIRGAFIELMQEKGFEAMTVSAIVRAAGINRGTFYLHYLDKFDLKQQLIDDTIDDLTEILVGDDMRDGRRSVDDVLDILRTDAIAEALRYVKREYAFFDAISRSGSDMQMYDRFKDVLKRMLISQAKRLNLTSNTYAGIPRPYAMEILVSSVASIIWLWIRGGCKETPERICAIIERNKTMAPVDILR